MCRLYLCVVSVCVRVMLIDFQRVLEAALFIYFRLFIYFHAIFNTGRSAVHSTGFASTSEGNLLGDKFVNNVGVVSFQLLLIITQIHEKCNQELNNVSPASECG